MLFKISIFYRCIVINLSYYKNIVLLLSVFTSFHHSCYISLIDFWLVFLITAVILLLLLLLLLLL